MLLEKKKKCPGHHVIASTPKEKTIRSFNTIRQPPMSARGLSTLSGCGSARVLPLMLTVQPQQIQRYCFTEYINKGRQCRTAEQRANAAGAEGAAEIRAGARGAEAAGRGAGAGEAMNSAVEPLIFGQGHCDKVDVSRWLTAGKQCRQHTFCRHVTARRSSAGLHLPDTCRSARCRRHVK